LSLFISSINSGSNGNCYYVGNEREAVLVDAGISCREITKRMKRLGLSIDKVRAIFVSHEHSDHIRGVDTLSAKYSIPVYITGETRLNSRLELDEDLVRSFKAYKPVRVGNLSITAFPKFHDAADPHSFIIEGNETCVGVFTDIGATCEHVIRNFKACHAVFLEANYDVQMLENGNYPAFLKKRIRGGEGHLSNDEALLLFREHKTEGLSHLLLSHLSRDNNSPKLVQEIFEQHAGGTQIVVASRYEESALFHINPHGVSDEIKKPEQLSLFSQA
jgi:phosphoribosyl 1,2-cyclic phosphodiesterase